MQCGICGGKIDEGSAVCRECGTLQSNGYEIETTITLSPVEIEEEYKEIDLTASNGPVLIVRKGPTIDQKFDLTKEEITLGRDPGSDIFLDDITVSRNHAKIMLTNDSVSIIDNGSLNGTYVNQDRIEGPRVLNSDDELQIGKFKMVFIS